MWQSKQQSKQHRRTISDDSSSSSSNSSSDESRQDKSSNNNSTRQNYNPRRQTNHHPQRHHNNNKKLQSRLQQQNQRRYAPPKMRQVTTNRTALPAESYYVALDCEMVGIGPGGYDSSLARVTVIDWYGQVLFDAHVQQTQPVTDYRTFVSGITEEDLQGATMSFERCRTIVLQLLHNRILVGHALENDLKVLNISLPWWLTRDTAKYEPFMQMRQSHTGDSIGILGPRKLKHLAKERLHKEIQVVGKPHSPYEDALAALDLYRSDRTHWEIVIQYNIEKTNQIHHQQLQQQYNIEKTNQIQFFMQRQKHPMRQQQQSPSVQVQ